MLNDKSTLILKTVKESQNRSATISNSFLLLLSTPRLMPPNTNWLAG